MTLDQHHLDIIASFWCRYASNAQIVYTNTRLEVYNTLSREELLRRAFFNGAFSGMDVEENIIIARNNLYDVMEVKELILKIFHENNLNFKFIDDVSVETYKTSVVALREWLEPKIRPWLHANYVTYNDVLVNSC